MALTIKQIYDYAQLAGAGYVDLSRLPNFTSETLIARARNEEPQSRMPEFLGTRFFTTEGWRILGDPRLQVGGVMVHTDPASGFAATLFQRGTTGEKILSVRGTDPATDNQIVQDIFLILKVYFIFHSKIFINKRIYIGFCFHSLIENITAAVRCIFLIK